MKSCADSSPPSPLLLPTDFLSPPPIDFIHVAKQRTMSLKCAWRTAHASMSWHMHNNGSVREKGGGEGLKPGWSGTEVLLYPYKCGKAPIGLRKSRSVVAMTTVRDMPFYFRCTHCSPGTCQRSTSLVTCVTKA